MPVCPNCGTSKYVTNKGNAKKVGTLGGLFIGAVAGEKAIEIAKKVIKIPLPPFRFKPSDIAAKCLLAMAGALVTSSIGERLGDKVDKNVLCLYHCNKCNSEFKSASEN